MPGGRMKLRLALVAFYVFVAAACTSDSLGASGSLPDERDRYIPAERVMDAIGVAPGMTIGEAGAGRGYFTFKLSNRVGDSGRVYANDIRERSLRYIESRCSSEAIGNIETIVGEVDDPLFPEPVDMVIMVYAFHEFTEPVAFLQNLKKYLKPGATVVVLDQDPEKTGSYGHFLPRTRVKELFAQSGYELVWEDDFLPRDMACSFRPAD